VHLPGSVVVVTGATRGIGRSTALELGRRGARVVAVGRDDDAGRSVAREAGGSWIRVDLRRPESALEVVRRTVAQHGRVDAVVANAGVGFAGNLSDMSPGTASELVELNLLAPILLARAALGPMRERRSGTLLFVTSIAGALGVPGESVYSATKAGLETFASVLREEARSEGIVVSTVLPGVVDTDFFVTRGRPYDRKTPKPMPVEQAAHCIVRVLERDRTRAIVPRWLTVPARLQAVAPRTYRALERRFG
jgi:short-subunit dehydrogenase